MCAMPSYITLGKRNYTHNHNDIYNIETRKSYSFSHCDCQYDNNHNE